MTSQLSLLTGIENAQPAPNAPESARVTHITIADAWTRGSLCGKRSADDDAIKIDIWHASRIDTFEADCLACLNIWREIAYDGVTRDASSRSVYRLLADAMTPEQWREIRDRFSHVPSLANIDHKWTIEYAQELSADDIRAMIDIESAREIAQESARYCGSDRMTRSTFDMPALGSLRLDEIGEVSILIEAPIDIFAPSEADWSHALRLDNTRQYIEWAKAGYKAPPVSAVENVSGAIVSNNRRRWLAARAADLKTLYIWFSPTVLDRDPERRRGSALWFLPEHSQFYNERYDLQMSDPKFGDLCGAYIRESIEKHRKRAGIKRRIYPVYPEPLPESEAESAKGYPLSHGDIAPGSEARQIINQNGLDDRANVHTSTYAIGDGEDAIFYKSVDCLPYPNADRRYDTDMVAFLMSCDDLPAISDNWKAESRNGREWIVTPGALVVGEDYDPKWIKRKHIDAIESTLRAMNDRGWELSAGDELNIAFTYSYPHEVFILDLSGVHRQTGSGAFGADDSGLFHRWLELIGADYLLSLRSEARSVLHSISESILRDDDLIKRIEYETKRQARDYMRGIVYASPNRPMDKATFSRLPSEAIIIPNESGSIYIGDHGVRAHCWIVLPGGAPELDPAIVDSYELIHGWSSWPKARASGE